MKWFQENEISTMSPFRRVECQQNGLNSTAPSRRLSRSSSTGNHTRHRPPNLNLYMARHIADVDRVQRRHQTSQRGRGRAMARYFGDPSRLLRFLGAGLALPTDETSPSAAATPILHQDADLISMEMFTPIAGPSQAPESIVDVDDHENMMASFLSGSTEYPGNPPSEPFSTRTGSYDASTYVNSNISPGSPTLLPEIGTAEANAQVSGQAEAEEIRNWLSHVRPYHPRQTPSSASSSLQRLSNREGCRCGALGSVPLMFYLDQPAADEPISSRLLRVDGDNAGEGPSNLARPGRPQCNHCGRTRSRQVQYLDDGDMPSASGDDAPSQHPLPLQEQDAFGEDAGDIPLADDDVAVTSGEEGEEVEQFQDADSQSSEPYLTCEEEEGTAVFPGDI